jgi:hypothetical protein
MGLFGNLFESKAVKQASEVEAGIAEILIAFHDRTGLPFILIFPIVHKVAARLYVEDFGPEVALAHYEKTALTLKADGVIRESMFKSFDWPEPAEHHRALVDKVQDQLWEFARKLISLGILKEAIASGYLNFALKGSAKGIDPLVAAGFFIAMLKELRAGVHTPPPIQRPEAPEGSDELVTLLFNKFRDLSYTVKDATGLEWQHLMPGMQRVSVIYGIKDRGKDGTRALLDQQVAHLAKYLDECRKNPPQDIPITPLHIQHMAKFNEAIIGLADKFSEHPEVRPDILAHSMTQLISQLAIAHYDLVFLAAIFDVSRQDIAAGKYDAYASAT